MHVPPFSPVNSEYPYYLRETIHPAAEASFTQDYLSRNGFKTDGWSNTGTPYFRVGEIGNGHGLDNGVISEYGMDFVRLLAGVGAGVTRPVDLFLCGHHHQRTEGTELKWNGSDVEFFMDFYMESPSTYYSTTARWTSRMGTTPSKRGEPVAIKIVPALPPAHIRNRHRDGEHSAGTFIRSARHHVPTAVSRHPREHKRRQTWWQSHRPIVAQDRRSRPHRSPSAL